MSSSDSNLCAKRKATENYNASAKQKAAAKLSASRQGGAGEVLKKPEWIRVKAGSPTTRFYEIKDDPAREQAQHRVRRSQLPQHRRMLWQGHGHLHDHGRQVHSPLPVLRCGPWPPRPAGCERAREPGQDHCPAQAQVRGDHQRGPRRPARRRRRPLCGVHPPHARTLARHPDRGAGARLPGSRRPRAGDFEGRAARCDEPQPGDRCRGCTKKRARDRTTSSA
jgi:hypothetical protein